jgi:hypothetical protein
MSGLGTSPGSSGGRNGSSARIAAGAPEDQQRQQQSDDEMPMVQATSVAETIMDTMRSLEQVGRFVRVFVFVVALRLPGCCASQSGLASEAAACVMRHIPASLLARTMLPADSTDAAHTQPFA